MIKPTPKPVSARLKVLAIETSIGATSIAVTGASGAVRVARLPRDRAQAERLLPLIKTLMEESGMGFADLDRIAVCIGPGGFSSIRTGVSAARGLGLAAKKPVVGASGFRIMASAYTAKWESEVHDPRGFGLAIPAGHSAVFCQCFDVSGGETTPIETLVPDEAAQWFAARCAIVSGPAADTVLERAAAAGLPLTRPGEDLAPDAATLAAIAPDLDPEKDLPVPLYARPADAKPQTGFAVERKPES